MPVAAKKGFIILAFMAVVLLIAMPAMAQTMGAEEV
jgi:Tfp pilus assembly protein FimT